jgi:hypothetical protein
MTHFLKSDTNPEGFKLEDIMLAIRKDVLARCVKVADDHRPEALHVMDNNMKILELLSEAARLATDSTHVLDKAFGPSHSAEGGPPRIGSE